MTDDNNLFSPFDPSASSDDLFKYLVNEEFTVDPFDSTVPTGSPQASFLDSLNQIPSPMSFVSSVPTQTQPNASNQSIKPTSISLLPPSSGFVNSASVTTTTTTTTNALLPSEPLPCFGDDKERKKQRRLLKNRESAQLSRIRKKAYVDELERKIEDISTENKDLNEEVVYLQGIIKQLSEDETGEMRTRIPPNIYTRLQRRATWSNNAPKAAAVCLLVVLFSIGLLLNAAGHESANTTQPSLLEFPSPHRMITEYANTNTEKLTPIKAEADVKQEPLEDEIMYSTKRQRDDLEDLNSVSKKVKFEKQEGDINMDESEELDLLRIINDDENNASAMDESRATTHPLALALLVPSNPRHNDTNNNINNNANNYGLPLNYGVLNIHVYPFSNYM